MGSRTSLPDAAGLVCQLFHSCESQAGGGAATTIGRDLPGGSRFFEDGFETAHSPVDLVEVVLEFEVGEFKTVQRLIELGGNAGIGGAVSSRIGRERSRNLVRAGGFLWAGGRPFVFRVVERVRVRPREKGSGSICTWP